MEGRLVSIFLFIIIVSLSGISLTNLTFLHITYPYD